MESICAPMKINGIETFGHVISAGNIRVFTRTNMDLDPLRSYESDKFRYGLRYFSIDSV